MSEGTVPFNPEAQKSYLDAAIQHWRSVKSDPNEHPQTKAMARCYIDAFQSVRVRFYGELLP